MLAAGSGALTSFFVEKTLKKEKGGQIFYTAQECGNEIFFGSDSGRVWRYQKKNGRFLLLQLPCASHIVAVGKIDEHNLIMVTETDGFFTYNTPAKTTVHYPASRLPGAPVHSIYIDMKLR